MPGYFTFESMISSSLIKVTYVIGMLFITIGSLAYAGIGIYNYANAPEGLRQALDNALIGHAVFGFAGLVLGNLVWRVLCETWILLFSLHDHIVAIDKALRERPIER